LRIFWRGIAGGSGGFIEGENPRAAVCLNWRWGRRKDFRRAGGKELMEIRLDLVPVSHADILQFTACDPVPHASGNITLQQGYTVIVDLPTLSVTTVRLSNPQNGHAGI
jgi:hypothetical protein